MSAENHLNSSPMLWYSMVLDIYSQYSHTFLSGLFVRHSKNECIMKLMFVSTVLIKHTKVKQNVVENNSIFIHNMLKYTMYFVFPASYFWHKLPFPFWSDILQTWKALKILWLWLRQGKKENVWQRNPKVSKEKKKVN